MNWTADPQTAMGVTERPFVVERNGDRIPGILWTPEGITDPLPLVLVGHGGSSEKRNPNGLALARRLVRHNELAVAAIDAIDHGERGSIRSDTPNSPEYAAIWQRPDTFDRMVADWKAVLDALAGLPEVDADRVGYWGLSMGTMLGLPFVAAEPRIKAAVLGLCGLRGSSVIRGRTEGRHRADAPKVTCPVQYFLQLDDAQFDFDGGVELFRLLGTPDKRLSAYPGAHAEMPPEGADLSRAFLAERLKG